MTDVPAPAPRPARSQRRQMIWLVIIVAAISTPFVAGWLSNGSDDPPPSLCDMLRSGWTADEIVDSDQWRDWPSSMSRTERGMTVLREAGRECPKLVGL